MLNNLKEKVNSSRSQKNLRRAKNGRFRTAPILNCFSHQLKFSTSYFFATLWCKPLIFQTKTIWSNIWRYQFVITKLSLLWAYQIGVTKLSPYQIVITKLSLPNCHNQIDITKIRPSFYSSNQKKTINFQPTGEYQCCACCHFFTLNSFIVLLC